MDQITKAIILVVLVIAVIILLVMLPRIIAALTILSVTEYILGTPEAMSWLESLWENLKKAVGAR